MDLHAWRPEDTARRFSLMLAGSLGTFAFTALWLAAGWPPLLAVLAGLLVGGLIRVVAFPLLRRAFGR